MDSKYEADKFSTASASSSSAAAAATVTTDVVGIRPKKKQKTAEGGRKITKARLAKEAATAAFEKSIWGGNHEKGMWFGVTNPAFGRPIWPGKPPEAIIGGHWPEADCVLVRDMKLVQLRHRLRYSDESERLITLHYLRARDPQGSKGKSADELRTNYAKHDFLRDEALDAAFEERQQAQRQIDDRKRQLDHQQQQLRAEAELQSRQRMEAEQAESVIRQRQSRQRMEAEQVESVIRQREFFAYQAGISANSNEMITAAAAYRELATAIILKKEKLQSLEEKNISDAEDAARLLEEKDAAIANIQAEHVAVTHSLDMQSMALAAACSKHLATAQLLDEKEAAVALARTKHAAAERKLIQQQIESDRHANSLMGLHEVAATKSGYSLLMGGGGDRKFDRMVCDLGHAQNVCAKMGWVIIKTLVDPKTNMPPFKDEIIKQMEVMMSNSGRGSKIFYLQFSGHGQPETGDWEVQPISQNKNKKRATFVSFDEVMAVWNQSVARRTGGRLLIVMDSCYSGVWVTRAAAAAAKANAEAAEKANAAAANVKEAAANVKEADANVRKAAATNVRKAAKSAKSVQPFAVFVQAACQPTELAQNYLFSPAWSQYAISVAEEMEKSVECGAPIDMAAITFARKRAAAKVSSFSGRQSNPVSYPHLSQHSATHIPLFQFEPAESSSSAAAAAAASPQVISHPADHRREESSTTLKTINPDFSLADTNRAKVASLNEAASEILAFGGLCPYCKKAMENPGFGCTCQKEKARLRVLEAAISSVGALAANLSGISVIGTAAGSAANIAGPSSNIDAAISNTITTSKPSKRKRKPQNKNDGDNGSDYGRGVGTRSGSGGESSSGIDSDIDGGSTRDSDHASGSDGWSSDSGDESARINLLKLHIADVELRLKGVRPTNPDPDMQLNALRLKAMNAHLADLELQLKAKTV